MYYYISAFHLILERERERERGSGKVVRDTTFGRQETITPILKVPRQCPLVLLVEVMRLIGINFDDIRKAAL
jgi:hypothetical protein